MRYRTGLIFITCASLLMMSLFYRASNAIIAPVLSSDLRLSPHDLGLLGGAFFYSFALIQLPLGLFMDRFGPKATMIVLNSVGVAGAVIFACSNSLFYAVAGRSMLGFGMAANLMGPLKIFTAWYRPERFATMSGAVLSLASVGGLAASSPLAILADLLGWRGSFYALAGLHLLLIFCLIMIVRDRPSDSKEVGAPREPASGWTYSFKLLFSSRSYWAISSSVFFRYGAFASIQFLWAGPFLIGFVGLSPIAAGNILLLMNLGYIFGAPAGGVLSDRVLRSRKRTVFLAYGIAACATFALAYCRSSTPLYLLGAVFFVMGFVNAFNQISFAHIKELMPAQISGSAMSGINFFLMMGAGVFTHALGHVLENASRVMSADLYYRQTFMICFGAFLASMVLYLLVREPGGTTRKRVSGSEAYASKRLNAS